MNAKTLMDRLFTLRLKKLGGKVRSARPHLTDIRVSINLAALIVAEAGELDFDNLGDRDVLLRDYSDLVKTLGLVTNQMLRYYAGDTEGDYVSRKSWPGYCKGVLRTRDFLRVYRPLTLAMLADFEGGEAAVNNLLREDFFGSLYRALRMAHDTWVEERTPLLSEGEVVNLNGKDYTITVVRSEALYGVSPKDGDFVAFLPWEEVEADVLLQRSGGTRTRSFAEKLN